MAYEVLARKWRPKNFSELVGQVSVEQTLINALKQGRLYPVLLFTGPRGTGKTSSARILAKNLRCQNQKNFIPCNKCEDCLLIQDSRHLDVIEIDGASNNGVDAIRELRDTVSYMPSTGSWKIYIIDEVHMLSQSAFNALLKTLEEPPEHVIFIMATTESRKIPQTVLSRVQRLDFHLLSPRLIQKQLADICKKEKFSVSEDILWIVAKQAQGSLRDAQSLLDQVITFCGKDLSVEKVISLLGLSDPQILFRCMQSLVHRKEGQMIKVIEDLRLKGNEPQLFLQSLIELFRDLLLLKKNPDNLPYLVQSSQQEIEQMKKEIVNASYEDLHFIFDMLLKGEREMTLCYDNRLVLEVLLLRFCNAPRLESILPLNPLNRDEKEEGEKPDFFYGKAVKPQTSSSDKASVYGAEQEIKNVPKKTQNKSSLPPEKSKEEFFEKVKKESLELSGNGLKKESKSIQTDGAFIKSRDKSSENESFKQRFDFLDFLREKDKALTALVENLCLKQKAQNHFYFSVPEKFSYLKSKVKDRSFQVLLEKQLTEFLNIKNKIKIEFLDNKKEELNLREEKALRDEDKFLQRVHSDPFANEVKKLFDGEIKPVIKNS